MTITVDPATIAAAAAFVGILLTVAGVFIRFGKLSNRIDTVEADVKELKGDVKQILGLLNTHQGYHQGLVASGELPTGGD